MQDILYVGLSHCPHHTCCCRNACLPKSNAFPFSLNTTDHCARCPCVALCSVLQGRAGKGVPTSCVTAAAEGCERKGEKEGQGDGEAGKAVRGACVRHPQLARGGF
jgi:hypothetical protein